MKKLIAMLLCIAMIAALGANAFAIIDEAKPSEKDTLTAAIKAEDAKAAAQLAEADKFERVGNFFNDLEKLGKAFLKETAGVTPAEFIKIESKYNQQIAKLGGENVDLAKFVNDNAALFTNMPLAVKAVGSGFDWDYTVLQAAVLAPAGDTYYDAEIITALQSGEWRVADAANHTAKADELQADLDVILAAEAEAAAKAAEAAAKAAEAAKEEAAAIRAANAAVKDPKTEAEQMKWNAAYAKYWLDKQLKDEKDDAKKAKDGVKTAQEAAVAQAKNAVERAQILAYQNMQAEIDKAVGEYLDGVKTALADFYWELYG